MSDIVINETDFGTKLDVLRSIPGLFHRAGSVVLNKAASGLRLHAAGLVAKDYVIQKREITARLQVLRATVGSLEARVVDVPLSKHSQIRMLRFVGKKYSKGPSTRKISTGVYTPAVGVPVKIKRADGYKPLPGAFTQVMKSGHIGVFRILYGNKMVEQTLASPLNILEQPKYYGLLAAHVGALVEKEMDVEIAKGLRK